MDDESDASNSDDYSESDSNDSRFGLVACDEIHLPKKLLDDRHSEVAASLKTRFRETDLNRDGTLDKDELMSLLRKGESCMADEEVEKLIAACDRNSDGKVNFEEFVDFLFAPISADAVAARDAMFDPEEVQDYVDKACDEIDALEDHADCVALIGESGSCRSDGIYKMPEVDWVVHAASSISAGRVGWRDSYRVYACDKRGLQLFRGSTVDGRKGWFLGRRIPEEGLAISPADYEKFNADAFAESPDQCCAMWETNRGEYDRQLCCNRVHLGAHVVNKKRTKTDHLLQEELWEHVDARALDEWEEQWRVQAGEVEGDDHEWDFENELELARQAEAEQDRASLAASKAERKRLQQAEADLERLGDEAAQAAAEKERRRLEKKERQDDEAGGNVGKKKRPKKYDPALDSRQVAPGFQVRQGHDHMAELHRKDKVDRKEELKRSRTAGALEANGPTIEQAGKKKSQLQKEEADIRKRIAAEDYSKYLDGGFVDHLFAPRQSSLGCNMAELVEGWERLPKLHDQACLFRYIAPNDVFCAGFAGNIWFMAGCAAVAEYPGWIQSMFGKVTELDRKGKYCVRLYHPGFQRFVRIIIDDYVPITSTGAPAFAGISVDGEIWAALVEKAFAKLCGSYAHSEWGQPGYALTYLCGGRGAEGWSRHGPSRWRNTHCIWDAPSDARFDRSRAEGVRIDGNWRDPDELWSVLRRYMELCFPVSCSVDKAKVSKKACGLQADRTYALLAAREVNTTDGRVLRIVFLRNPFGLGEWTGRWGDDSKAWASNPQVAAALQFKPKKDGAFWMGYNDFLLYFEAIDVVKKSMPIQGSNLIKLGGLERGLKRHNSKDHSGH